MTVILNALLEITAYSAVLFAVIWLFRLLLKKHLSPAMLYAAWFLLIARLLLPVTITSSFSFFIIPAEPTRTAETQLTTPPAAEDATTLAPQTETEASYKEPADPPSDGYQPAANTNYTQVQTKPFAWRWDTALVLLWLGGAAAMLLTTVSGSLRLKRRLKKAACSPPPEWEQLMQRIQKELGIKSGIRLMVMEDFVSPALIASLRPVVVMPESMRTQDEEQVEFALRHELTHLKRRDHVVCLMLALIKAAYWFNPFVWLAISQMKMDMETACDGMVVKLMDNNRRKMYAATVIDMYAKGEARFVLGMALGTTKQTAEQRLRGIYMRRRSSRPARMTAALLACVMLLACFTTACQPTPEEPVVIGKADNHLEEMIASSAQSAAPSASPSPTPEDPGVKTAALLQSIGAADTCKETFTNKKGDINVYIDADVEVPAVTDIPAVNVSFAPFTQEMVDKYAAYFLKGAPVYTQERVDTKDDIMEWIVYTQSQLAWAKENTPKDKSYIKQLEEQIADYTEQYKKAPEEKERTPATLELKETEYGMGLSVVADLGKDEAASFSVYSNEQGSTLGFENEGKGDYDYIGPHLDPVDGIPRGMTMTLDTAQKMLAQCLTDLNIGNVQVESVDVGTFWSSINNLNDDEYRKSAKQCYVFTLVRTVRGIPVPDIEDSTSNDGDDPSMPVPQEPEYTDIPQPERFVICIDDTGIVRFEWMYPLQEDAVLSEHVTLMPFADIVEKAKDYMFYKTYTASNCRCDIHITEIRLSMMRIMKKDEPGQYMLVPVWDFIGNREQFVDDGEGEWLPFGDQSYLTINAIDSSNIRRDWGY